VFHSLDVRRRWRLAADIPRLIRRVGAHHQKISACLNAAMARTSGQYRYIAGFHLNLVAIFTAQHQPGIPGGKAQHFVGR
jgi:hypothetical protein